MGIRQEKKVGARFWGEIGLFLGFNLVMGNVFFGVQDLEVRKEKFNHGLNE